MNSLHLVARFTLNQQLILPAQFSEQPTKTASAVVLPLVDVNNQAHVLLCKRANYLVHHPSEICLPGGKFGQPDIRLRHTALT